MSENMNNLNDPMNNQMNNPEPDKNDNDPKEKMRRKVKKAATVALCAVLAGGITVGAYEGVGNLTGWNSRNVSAASSKENKLTMADGADTKEAAEETEAVADQNTEKTLLQTKTKKADSDDADEAEEDAEEEESTSTAKGSLDVSDIAAEGMKSVVSITTKSVQEVQNYLGYYGFGDNSSYTTQQEVEGSGSGIIVGKNDDELLIATNYHVIEDADTVTVTCIDGAAYEASVKGYDEDKDLAVVSVAVSDLDSDTLDEIEVATIGSSDDLKVGEQVIAIGNALGYGQSVTTGIVSAKNRKIDSNGNNDEDSDGVNLIQTDAAINPGNSGGALMNMNGEVVGINSSKLASTEVEGMGYAIAISDVSDILEDLMNATPRDKVENHGVLGITGMTVSDEASQYYGVPEGVLVSEVSEGSGAEKAGIKAKSVITEFDGKRVRSIDALVELLNYYEPGEEVEVTIEVANGESYEEQTVTVTLGENENADSEDSSDESEDSSEEAQEQQSTDDLFGSGSEDGEEQQGNGGFSFGDFFS